MNWMQWIILVLLLGSVAVSLYYYDSVPEYMATHWDAAGEPDGYMEKGTGLFLMPAVLVLLVVFFYLIPHIDPLKENIRKFDQYYEGFIFILVFFLAYVHFLSLAWNIGYSFDVTRMTVPALGVLFVYLGVLCGKCRQNWFIGVRTPWTLSSEHVWERTHDKAKDVFLGVGVLWIVVGLLAPEYVLYMVGLLILAAVWLFVDSYFEYKKEKEGGGIPAEAVPVAKAAPMKTKAGAAAKKKAVKKKAPKKKPAAKIDEGPVSEPPKAKKKAKAKRKRKVAKKKKK